MLEIAKSEFKARRERLLSQMDSNSVAIVFAANEVTRSRDTEFTFRQNSDFYYLTGFNEPDAVLLLIKDKQHSTSILFCLDKDPQAEIWHGRRIGSKKAKTDYLFDAAHGLSSINDKLLELVSAKQVLYFAQGESAACDKQVFTLLAELRNKDKKTANAPSTLKDIRTLIHPMRLIKSPNEISIMRLSCEIAANGHKRAMCFAHPGASEFQLAAELHHHYAMHGAPQTAYASIVGAGDNANILHYTNNSDVLNSGDLVLIDSGCEFQGYAADITRTFPINGQFNPWQAALYEVVLNAQLAAFSAIKPGGYLSQANMLAMQVLTQGLLKLGILKGNFEDLMAQQACKQFYMHGIGHWLGLDVHDVGDYKQENQERALAQGMVLTIEPGLYISKDANVPEHYKGIGIRIEDNLVVCATGYENLTHHVPKTIAEIEALMNSANKS
ncbi:Xaa-Pro aminopeptidase [Pseudoalteromonas sp. MMG010]|uniref:Xaa-Pro aminopeptidase n=1 Tax=Pseudoalteromonas sp. MMG010 TaxID=2822685 RepID=UPI001B3A3191|nr:Xaa-Pro aminopeptidase [Pseudoalteromonas sp. MMG010]MBQ4832156.1 Xaa-Pro aminopeptidase [Pseudoalteromonas sp. MMG010]